MNNLSRLMQLAIEQEDLSQDTWFVFRAPDSVIADHVIREMVERIGATVGTTVAACRAHGIPAGELWVAHPKRDYITVHGVPC